MERLPHVDDLYFSESLLCLFPKYSSSLYCTDLRRPGDLVEIEYPLGWERIVLLGSCRGALCIYNEDDGQVAIWNPSTRICKLLPPADAEGIPGFIYGFGYDDENEEYVLLRLIQTLDVPIVSVSIYRQRANAWRRLQGILPYSLVDPRTMGVFLGGHLYWIMRRDPNSPKVLVAFDIHTENSVEAHQLSYNSYLAVPEGRLCLISYRERGGVRAWIASEYGLEDSRDRLFLIRDYSMGWVLLQPLAYSQNGRQVLLLYHRTSTLVWYDLLTHDEKLFHINGMPGSFEAATCSFSGLERSMVLCLFSMVPSRLYCIGFLMDVSEIEYPRGWLQIELIGSCCGRLCISYVGNQDVAIRNPSGRWHKVLPPADVEIAHILGPFARVHGFGYDDELNEYVLLKLVQTLEEPIECAVSIYRSSADARSSTDAWRPLQGMPYYLSYPLRMGVFVCCHLHWIMRRERAQDSARVLVAFNIRTEEFVEVELPDFIPDDIDNMVRMDLAVLEGCLCLTIYSWDSNLCFIRKDYRSNDSWEMLFLVEDRQLDGVIRGPLAFSQNGCRVLVQVSYRFLIWYNLVTHDVERFHIKGMPDFFMEATCL